MQTGLVSFPLGSWKVLNNNSQGVGFYFFEESLSHSTYVPLNILSGGAFSLLNWVGKIDAQEIFIECVLNK